jgi:hypothetical protein
MIDFEDIGYFKEFYLDSKFIGTVACELNGREIGYYGRLVCPVFDDIKLDNKKIIKAGSVVTTMIFPLCGRVLPRNKKQ